MKRYCLVIEIKERFIDAYSEIHRNPWPGILESIKENGAKELLIWNYENFFIVYYECEDIDRLYEELNKLEIKKKWNATVRPWFKKTIPTDKKGKFHTCMKIFDLKQQLEGKLEKY